MAVKTPPLYLDGNRNGPTFVLMMLILLAGSLLLVGVGTGVADPAADRMLCKAIVAAWVLLPPLWFLYEDRRYFPAHGNPEAGATALQAAQRVYSRLWLASAGALVILYFQRFGITV